MDYSTFSTAKIKFLAEKAGLTVEEWKAQQDEMGKPTDPPQKTPAMGQTLPPAGDSSSGDISLESPNLDPYYFTDEDLSGSEEEVVSRVRGKLAAVGIDIEEYIPGADAISLKSKATGGSTSSSWNKNRKPNKDALNEWITANADLDYAKKAREGREDLIKGYKEAITVEPQDFESAKNDLVQNKISEWKKREKLDFGMGQVQTIELKESDFETPEEYNEYKSWKNTGVYEAPEEVVNGYRTNKAKEQARLNGENYAADLGADDASAIYSVVNKEAIDLQEDVKNFDTTTKAYNENVKLFEAAVEQHNANPTEQSLADIRSMQVALIKESQRIEDVATRAGDIDDISLAIQHFGTDFSRMNQLGIGFKNIGVQMGYGAAQLGSYMAGMQMGGPGMAEIMKANTDQAFRQTLQDVNLEMSNFRKGPSFDQALSSVDNFATWAAGTTVQAVPSLTMAFTGAAAMPLFFLSGYGSKASEQSLAKYEASQRMAENAKLLENEDLSDEERQALNQLMEEDAKVAGIDTWREMTSSMISGVAEVAFERLTTINILNRANKIAVGLRPTIAQGTKQFAKDAAEEAFGEGGTEFANNFADIYVLGEDKNLFDGVAEAAVGGALIGGPLSLKGSMPAAYNSIVSELQTSKQAKELKSKIEQLSSLVGVKDLNNVLDPSVQRGRYSPETEKLISDITQEIEGIKESIVGRIGNDLTKEDLIQVGELNLKMRQINKQFTDMATRGASAAELNSAEKILREKFDKLAEQRNAILTDKSRSEKAEKANNALAVSFDAKQGYAAMQAMQLGARQYAASVDFDNLNEVERNRLLAEAKERTGSEDKLEIERDAKNEFFIARNERIIEKNKEASERYLQNAGIDATMEYATDEQFADELVKAGQFKSQKQALDAIKAGLAPDAMVNGDNTKVFVHARTAARNGRTGVFSHEALHVIVGQQLSNSSANKAGENLLKWLENNSPETFAYVRARLETSYEGNEAYFEEAMNVLSDYIAEGNKVDLGLIDRLSMFIKDIVGKNNATIAPDSGKDTFAFIATYAAKNKNKKTQAIIDAFVNQIGADEEDKERGSKLSVSNPAARAKEVLEKVSSNMDYFDPNSPLIARVVPGMIQAQLASYQNKGLKFDMQEAISEVVMRLYAEGDIAKFNGKGTLYGYLNGRIKFRILDAFKNNKDLVENFSESSIDNDEFQNNESQTGLVAEEAVTTEQIEERKEAERPQYRSLTEAKVVTPEGMDMVRQKVLSTVRVMKKRMDESVSKNVTVKPYIEELRQDFGKQIDIILKKEMGTVKERALQKWLLKNKKAILENMTTTWMMRAMPNAIQKRVNGEWTLDWKDKKIDRESVATDNAGRTSGAELVRRLPKASLKMSDADFMSNFFDESGALIRGRKESLAKAIGEELGFEMFKEALLDPESDIRQAFEMRQDLLEVEIKDTFVAEVLSDVERGNVKFSKTILIEAIDAKLFGDEDGYNLAISRLPEELRTKANDLIEEYIVGFGISGFKEPLKAFINGTSEAGIPPSPEVLQAFDLYLATPTSKLNKADTPKESIKQLRDASEKLINATPPQLVAKLGRAAFGFGGSKDIYWSKKLEAAYNRKRKQAEKMKGKNVWENVTPISHSLINNILNDALSKDFETAEAKREYIKEKYGSKLIKIKLSNQRALEQLLGTVAELSQNDPSLLTGFLRIFERQTNLRSFGLASLTGISEIQVTAESQAVYVNNITGEYLNSLDRDQYLMFKQGDIVINRNHPNYKAAVEWQKKYGTKDKDGNYRKGIDEYLKPKGEHVYPSAKMWAQSALIISNYISSKAANPESNAADVLMRKDIFEYARDFDQQINSQILSDIQDKTFGNTSEAGVFRSGSLTKEQAASLVNINTGVNVVERLGKAVTSLNRAVYMDAATDNKSRLKLSRSVPQAIFMVGGAGSGKSSVIKKLGLLDNGWKIVNQDISLEQMKLEEGLPADEKAYDKEQRSLRAKLGHRARKIAEEKMAKYRDRKDSMIVDGTGGSFNATKKKMDVLEAAGFEIHMLHVKTSKDVALARNEARAERSLASFIVSKNWDAVNESSKQYKEIYGERFHEIDTDNLGFEEALPAEFVDKFNTVLNKSKAKFSNSLDTEFNEMIYRNKGVSPTKIYSSVQAKMLGEKKGKYRIFVPSSADDFRGLTSYAFAGKGKQGEADQRFFEEKLINPYVRGVAQIDAVKQQVRREYNAAAKENKAAFKMLGKKIGKSGFTYDQALRVYLWTQQGIQIPGLDKDDIRFLTNEINQFPKLIELGYAMQMISRQDTWIEPSPHWMSHTLVSELNSMTEKVGRKNYLSEFIDNADIIFSPDNLNKIEAIYGSRHREALEDALYSMKNGRNRPSGMNKQMNMWMNWVNNSTGAIMFFNIRSAVLQTLSATNFINWSDNNPIKAAAAFANQKQYWSDFAMIFNSDKLKQRRSGLQTDVNEAEIANQADGAQNKASAVIAYLLKIGFTPTQIADSFAIAMGGASFYRNRVNTYLKQGMEQKAAEEKAWEDFGKTADEAQQSSDPYLVSQEQRSPLGRLVLAFQNTPMQYTRLMKKAMLDLAAGRGDAKTHISKIIYYGAVQNFVFSALQSALFAMIPGFDDDEEEMDEKALEKKQRSDDAKILRIINSMTDSILKGSGVKGAALATIKNTITEFFKQEEKGFTADHTYTILQALSLSPPIGSKARKIYAAIQSNKFEKDVLEARGFSVMADGRVNLSPAYSIIGSLASGVANVPMDRMVDIVTSYSEALDERNKAWQRIALALGWKTWDVGAKNEEHDLIKSEAKAKRKEEGRVKAKKTREENKKKKEKEKIEKAARAKEKWLRENKKK